MRKQPKAKNSTKGEVKASTEVLKFMMAGMVVSGFRAMKPTSAKTTATDTAIRPTRTPLRPEVCFSFIGPSLSNVTSGGAAIR